MLPARVHRKHGGWIIYSEGFALQSVFSWTMFLLASRMSFWFGKKKRVQLHMPQLPECQPILVQLRSSKRTLTCCSLQRPLMDEWFWSGCVRKHTSSAWHLVLQHLTLVCFILLLPWDYSKFDRDIFGLTLPKHIWLIATTYAYAYISSSYFAHLNQCIYYVVNLFGAQEIGSYLNLL